MLLTNEVVVLSGLELQAPGLRCEGPESDGEVHEFVGLVAHCDDSGFGVRYMATIVLFFAYLKFQSV